LGADEYAGLSAIGGIKDLLHGTFASGAIPINAQYFSVGKTLLQVGFTALGAFAGGD
tara:strand:- start:178 stop:348 length:171 start_codon:yes stop_codon:yes gene_type:complete